MKISHKDINRKNGIMPVSQTLWEGISLDGEKLRIFLTVQFFEETGLKYWFNLSINGWTKKHSEDLKVITDAYNELADDGDFYENTEP